MRWCWVGREGRPVDHARWVVGGREEAFYVWFVDEEFLRGDAQLMLDLVCANCFSICCGALRRSFEELLI